MKAVIFDFDGTLFDTAGVWEDLDLEFYKIYNKIPSKKFREKVKIISLYEFARLFKIEFKVEKTVDEILREIEILIDKRYEHIMKIKKYAKEYIKYLYDEDIPMCIVSLSTRKNIELALKKLGIWKYFKFIIASEDIVKGKEEPDIFLKCSELLKEKPTDILVFEDSYVAIKTAKKLGFKVVAVYDSLSKSEFIFSKEISDYHIYNFKEMEGLI